MTLSVHLHIQDDEHDRSRTIDMTTLPVDMLALLLQYPEAAFQHPTDVPFEYQLFLAPPIANMKMLLAGQCVKIREVQTIMDRPGDMRVVTENLAEIWIKMMGSRPALSHGG